MGRVLTTKNKILLFPIWVITLLPMRILYLLSDLFFLIIYYVLRYRRKVVMDNLSNSFPDKGKVELKHIAIGFYHYLSDYFLESVYLINMSLKECNRRYQYKNKELINRLYKEGKSVIFASSHYGNWDWAANLATNFPYKIFGVYKPLSNKTFNNLFIDLREKFGAFSIPLLHTIRVVIDSAKRNELYALYLVADQRPLLKDVDYWTTFMNQKTPILTGMEKLAKRFDIPVVFFNMKRVKRGYYEVTFELITETPEETKDHEISERYISMVEQLIREQPEYYLWSHKRWKYSPEVINPKSVTK